MEKKEFKITIDAPREQVWQILWDDATYPKWTTIFGEGSRAETDWKEGSKALFLSATGDGMLSRVVANRPYECMAFEHLGEVKDGQEYLDSELAKQWAGAIETYTLENADGKTVLTVVMDIADEHMDYFLSTWPKALEKVKELSEEN
ncbi:SRPBCC family protein [Salmonirosea aquatica]|uniref:SRPBCC domain-containing protein n=1 Tax=Salmonirosea aquatica TaxID=2654236 RepID=A0A7C9FRS6_9BACT|nr:SRPBCC domain-containing protein [Cytophagaceae bacterium SJW1-29]